MKIHIIGGPGSGKTRLAYELSKEFRIPHYDLDDIQWDNKSTGYGKKREQKERDTLLAEILKQHDWIIEGVYYAWCGQCFADADKIYLLNVPRKVYRSRIIRRFIRRKLGLEKSKKETFKSVRELLRWADKYQENNLIEIRELLTRYVEKVVEQ